MRVEIFTASNVKDLASELNAVLEGCSDEEIEIQYQHCASQTDYGWKNYFSAMVIFK